MPQITPDESSEEKGIMPANGSPLSGGASPSRRPGSVFRSIHGASFAASLALIAGLTLWSAVEGRAQSLEATVIGRVLDAETNESVEGAVVGAAGVPGSQVTDDLGQFRLERLRPGSYEIQVRHLAYGLQSDSLVVTAGEQVMVEFRVATRPIEIAGLSVTARSREVDASVARGSRFDGMSSEEVDAVRTRVATMGDLVAAARVPGLTVRQRPDSMCIESNRFRRRFANGPTCHMVQVVVDDLLMQDAISSLIAMDPQRVDRFELVPPIEAGVLYGDMGRYGVLRIYTEDGRGPALGLDDHAPIGPRWTLSFAVSARGTTTLYDGTVLIRPNGRDPRATFYTEEVGAGPGLEGSVRWNTGRFGFFGLSVFGGTASSTGTYQTPTLSTQTFDRSFQSAGADLWFAFNLLRGEAWNAQLGFGPTFMWQRLELNRGSNNQLADPIAENPPQVEWTDRTWFAPGGHLFADLTYDLGPASGIFAGLVFRAVATGGDTVSWSRQDAEDILRSTGNSVDVQYSAGVATSLSLRTGVRWYPGNKALF
jgi:hypothetical protein